MKSSRMSAQRAAHCLWMAAIFAGALAAQPAGAQSVPVSVVNKPTVNINGTVPVSGSVSVSNFPGSVNVGNFPASVNVGNFPASMNVTATTPLNVNATISGPVTTQDAARTPFGYSCSSGPFGSLGGSQAGCTLATVPFGQMLVIETVSCFGELVQPTAPTQPLLGLPVQLITTAVQGGGNLVHVVMMSPYAHATPGDSPAYDGFATSATPVKIYAVGAGTGVGFNVSAGSSIGFGGVTCTISGYATGL